MKNTIRISNENFIIDSIDLSSRTMTVYSTQSDEGNKRLIDVLESSEYTQGFCELKESSIVFENISYCGHTARIKDGSVTYVDLSFDNIAVVSGIFKSDDILGGKK